MFIGLVGVFIGLLLIALVQRECVDCAAIHRQGSDCAGCVCYYNALHAIGLRTCYNKNGQGQRLPFHYLQMCRFN